jgi:hypothetical protein
MTMTKSLGTAVLLGFLYACGGGGGGVSADTTATTLRTSVGSLSDSHVTVGSAAALTGSEVVASVPSLLNRLKALFTPVAFADTISSCSKSALLGSTDSQTWTTLGLTGATDTPPCVTQSQDAGRYLILETSTLTDTNGNACDLVAVRKATGATTCLSVNIPLKAQTGALTFFLDESSGQTPGQLTLNGKYFFVGFKATTNADPAVHGFVRVDLDGEIPTAFTAYARSGSASLADADDIDGYSPFFAPFYGLENGDLTVTLFNSTGQNPNTGTLKSYYVVVDKTQADATQMTRVQYNTTPVTSSNGYSVDMTAALGGWYKQNIDASATEVDYNNDAFSTPSVVGERAIYFTIGSSPVRNVNSCGSQARTLVKASFDATAGTVSFTDLGVSGLTSGLGSNYVTNNVTPDSSGSNLFSLYLHKVSATQVKLVKTSKTTSSDACSSSVDIAISDPVDQTLTDTANGSNAINAFTFRTADTVFIQTFSYNPENNNVAYGCVASSGCPVASHDVAYAYDIASGQVSNIDLSAIQNTDFRVAHQYSSITATRVALKMIEATASGTRPVHAEMGVSAVANVIKFPLASTVSQGVFSGSE